MVYHPNSTHDPVCVPITRPIEDNTNIGWHPVQYTIDPLRHFYGHFWLRVPPVPGGVAFRKAPEKMAGDWIKISHGLIDKPEVMELAEMMDVSPFEVVGHLVAFWFWVDLNLSPDCPQVKGTKKGLDRVAGRDGFAESLCRVGWLIVEDGMISVPNYDVHLSCSAKNRAKEQRKKASQRSKTSPNIGDKKGTTEGTNEGPEKRREENKITHTLPAPDWLAKDWKRWCDYREARDGRPMDAILSETVLMDLMRRGDGKAQRDVEFSILKQAKSILDSDNDFAKRTGQTSTGTRRYGKPTAEEIRKQQEAENPPTAEDIESRNKILKLSKEIYDESVRR